LEGLRIFAVTGSDSTSSLPNFFGRKAPWIRYHEEKLELGLKVKPLVDQIPLVFFKTLL
jgi:hypothetical protein